MLNIKKVAVVFVAFSTILFGGCSDEATARRVVEDHGFTNIEVTGYRWTGCSEKDTYHTGFRATAPNGRRVSGVVCSGIGWGKSNTLRLD